MLSPRIIYALKCDFCGYCRYVEKKAYDAFMAGERYYGSRECPACSCANKSCATHGNSAAFLMRSE